MTATQRIDIYAHPYWPPCAVVLAEDCQCSVLHQAGQLCLHTPGWHDDGVADHEFAPPQERE